MCLNLITLKENLTKSEANRLKSILGEQGIHSVITGYGFYEEDCVILKILKEDLGEAQQILKNEDCI